MTLPLLLLLAFPAASASDRYKVYAPTPGAQVRKEDNEVLITDPISIQAKGGIWAFFPLSGEQIAVFLPKSMPEESVTYKVGADQHLSVSSFEKRGAPGSGRRFSDISVEEAMGGTENDIHEQMPKAKIISKGIEEKKINAGILACEELQFSEAKRKAFKMLLCSIATKRNVLVMGLSPVSLGEEKQAHSFFDEMSKTLKYEERPLTRADVARVSIDLSKESKAAPQVSGEGPYVALSKEGEVRANSPSELGEKLGEKTMECRGADLMLSFRDPKGIEEFDPTKYLNQKAQRDLLIRCKSSPQVLVSLVQYGMQGRLLEAMNSKSVTWVLLYHKDGIACPKDHPDCPTNVLSGVMFGRAQ